MEALMRKENLSPLLRFLDDRQKITVREAALYVVAILGLLIAAAATYLAIQLT